MFRSQYNGQIKSSLPKLGQSYRRIVQEFSHPFMGVSCAPQHLTSVFGGSVGGCDSCDPAFTAPRIQMSIIYFVGHRLTGFKIPSKQNSKMTIRWFLWNVFIFASMWTHSRGTDFCSINWWSCASTVDVFIQPISYTKNFSLENIDSADALEWPDLNRNRTLSFARIAELNRDLLALHSHIVIELALTAWNCL